MHEAAPRPAVRGIDRRRFLRASARAALAAPSLPALLAACTPERRPRTRTPSPNHAVARPDEPVVLSAPGGLEAIAPGLAPESGATLDLYTWDRYLWHFVVDRFAEQNGASFRIATFADLAREAVPRLASGTATPDVFWTTFDYLSRLVAADLLLPLQHAYIPNLRANVWSTFRDPFYDRGWRYSVPYAVYATGIEYRRDRVHDDEVAERGWAILWDARYAGRVAVYDDYREAIAAALLRRGVTDLDTGDPDALDAAERDLLTLRRRSGVRVSADDALTGVASGKVLLAQARSGDAIAAQAYLPAGTPPDVLGFWRPEDGRGPVGNDTMVVPAAADDPVLAHLFLDFMLDGTWAMRNFAWTGYQPPIRSIDSDRAIGGGYVPEPLAMAILREDDLDRGIPMTELASADDGRWQDVWRSFTQAG